MDYIHFIYWSQLTTIHCLVNLLELYIITISTSSGRTAAYNNSCERWCKLFLTNTVRKTDRSRGDSRRARNTSQLFITAFDTSCGDEYCRITASASQMLHCLTDLPCLPSHHTYGSATLACVASLPTWRRTFLVWKQLCAVVRSIYNDSSGIWVQHVFSCKTTKQIIGSYSTLS